MIMPYDDPEADDPMELVAQSVPAGADDVDQMASAIADEYARVGFDREGLLALFREPRFVLTHAVHQRRGDAWCVELVDRTLARWRRG
jgi:hypothetical protein